MNSPPPVIDLLRRMAGPGPDDVSDGELLNRFVGSRDEGAFEALVRRHGGLVWGACRRRLRDPHAADDAFQATFLALARHAASIRRADAVAAWLHRVAVRCSASLRPPQNPMRPPSLDVPARGPDPLAAAAGQELDRVIDEEIDALPEPFREAFVLCEVEQRTAADAAMAIGVPVGTVESRLTRARQRLRARLVRRGVSAGAMTGLGLAAVSVPASARAGAVAFATGASHVPAALIALADRAARIGFKSVTLAIGLASGVGLFGLGGLIWVLAQGPGPGLTGAQQGGPGSAAAEIPITEPERFRRSGSNFPLPPEAIDRVGDPWLRHGGTPQRLAYSGDGKFLATGGPQDRWIRVWDLSVGRVRAHLLLANGELVAALALTGDGRTLRAVIVCGTPRATQLREYDTYRVMETHRRQVLNGPAETVAFDQNGTLLAVGKNAQVRLYDTASATEKWRAEVPSANRVEVAVSPNGKRVAAVVAGTPDVRLFDAATGRSAGTIADPKGTLSQPTFSADGGHFAAFCSTTVRIRVWDVDKGQVTQSVKPRFPICGFAIAPDASSVVGFSPNGPAWLFPAEPDKQAKVFGEVLSGVAGRFSPDGTAIAIGSQLGPVQLLDPNAARPLPGSPSDVMTPRPVAFSADGKRLLVEGFQWWTDCPVKAGDAPVGRISPDSGPHDTLLLQVSERAALSPDRKLIARVSAKDEKRKEYVIDLLDAGTKAPRGRIDVGQFARRPVFSPDGERVYAITADRFVRAWEVKTGKEVLRSAVPLTAVYCGTPLVVSSDGRHVAVAERNYGGKRPETTRVFDATTGALVLSAAGLDGQPLIAFSPDGRWFAATVPPDDPRELGVELRVWEMATGKVKMSVPTPGGQPAFSPDGRTLAVNHEDAVVLLELATGCVRHEFRHHGTVETALVWRPDGRAIVAASSEAPIYLWDVAGNQTGALPEWDAKEDERRWVGLCGSDAPQAFQTLRQFVAHPAKAIAYLKEWMPANSSGRLAARGCEALELIANPEAKRLLGEWATGPVDSPLTVEAKDSLRRLGRT